MGSAHGEAAWWGQWGKAGSREAGLQQVALISSKTFSKRKTTLSDKKILHVPAGNLVNTEHHRQDMKRVQDTKVH